MRPKSKVQKMSAQTRDGKRSHAAKRATVARKRARAIKAERQGR